MLQLGFRLLLQIYKIIAAGVPTDRYYYNNLTLSPLRESGNHGDYSHFFSLCQKDGFYPMAAWVRNIHFWVVLVLGWSSPNLALTIFNAFSKYFNASRYFFCL